MLFHLPPSFDSVSINLDEYNRLKFLKLSGVRTEDPDDLKKAESILKVQLQKHA